MQHEREGHVKGFRGDDEESGEDGSENRRGEEEKVKCGAEVTRQKMGKGFGGEKEKSGRGGGIDGNREKDSFISVLLFLAVVFVRKRRETCHTVQVRCTTADQFGELSTKTKGECKQSAKRVPYLPDMVIPTSLANATAACNGKTPNHLVSLRYSIRKNI